MIKLCQYLFTQTLSLHFFAFQITSSTLKVIRLYIEASSLHLTKTNNSNVKSFSSCLVLPAGDYTYHTKVIRMKY